MTENEAKDFLGRFSLDRIGYANGKEVDMERFDYFTEVLVTAMKALSEIQQYRAIGTVEECREARERQRGKKPKHQGCYDNNRVWHEWNGINGKPYELCPNCEANLCCEMPYDRKPKYCDKCGQKLDWSDTD